MKTIGLTAALLILGAIFIAPAAYAHDDDGGGVSFGITISPPAVLYGPPPVIYGPPRGRVFWPPDDDDDRYRRYHRDDRDRRYRDDDDRGRYENRYREYGHRRWEQDHRYWNHDHRHDWRSDDQEDER